MLKKLLAIVVLLTAVTTSGPGAVAQQQCSTAEDWLALKNELLSVPESGQEAVYQQFSPECQAFFMAGLELAPGSTLEKAESPASTQVVVGDSGNSLAATCRTTTYTKTKYTAFGFVAWKFHAHLNRCFDGSRLYGQPTMWTTFSEVDGFMDIQNYVSENDYWNPYAWKYQVYEQRQVKNCIWSGCIATYYPYASGWMTGSGSTYLEISAG